MDVQFDDEIIDGRKVGEWLVLAGMRAVSAQVAFKYGEGGDGVSVLLQTSVDEGRNAIDIAHFRFAKSDARKIANVTGLVGVSPINVTEFGLKDDSILDGFLGDRIRFVVVASGNYKNSSVSVNGAAR